MNLVFAPQAWEDYLFWQRTDLKILLRIHELIRDILRHPTTGIGKPERLRFPLQGFRSRRITLEHRIVYSISKDAISIAQLRYHY